MGTVKKISCYKYTFATRNTIAQWRLFLICCIIWAILILPYSHPDAKISTIKQNSDRRGKNMKQKVITCFWFIILMLLLPLSWVCARVCVFFFLSICFVNGFGIMYVGRACVVYSTGSKLHANTVFNIIEINGYLQSFDKCAIDLSAVRKSTNRKIKIFFFSILPECVSH